MKMLKANEKTENPKVAVVLNIFGWLAIVGCALAGFEAGSSGRWGFEWIPALIYWASGIGAGAVFIGFAKVIELLAIIANKDYVIVENSGDDDEEDGNS